MRDFAFQILKFLGFPYDRFLVMDGSKEGIWIQESFSGKPPLGEVAPKTYKINGVFCFCSLCVLICFTI